jgi:hypothetical protein
MNQTAGEKISPRPCGLGYEYKVVEFEALGNSQTVPVANLGEKARRRWQQRAIKENFRSPTAMPVNPWTAAVGSIHGRTRDAPASGEKEL